MRIAFVGIKRSFKELGDYIPEFVRYHLELPFYYAIEGCNEVTVTTVDFEGIIATRLEHGKTIGAVECITEDKFPEKEFDVVVHWRKWFPEFYNKNAINVINCQDHSFPQEWKDSVHKAFDTKELRGILCFPHWHRENLSKELGLYDDVSQPTKFFHGMTLGVDTDVYKPDWDKKNPYQMLWAADPGRGLDKAIELAVKLFMKDKRFRLNICYPDYAKPPHKVNHPALVWHNNLKNGAKLWNLFNTSGIAPYTSCFPEPSSRFHRQAMSAGCLVLYPPNMGTPSDLIKDNHNGLVRDISTWKDLIIDEIETGSWKIHARNARELAEIESWLVQAQRFNKVFGDMISK